MKNKDSSVRSFHGTPKADPERRCGTSGAAETHEHHLEKVMKQMLTERGYPEIDPESADDPYPEQPLAYFLVQMDKSTYQSYNLAENFFGYNGIPTK